MLRAYLAFSQQRPAPDAAVLDPSSGRLQLPMRRLQRSIKRRERPANRRRRLLLLQQQGQRGLSTVGDLVLHSATNDLSSLIRSRSRASLNIQQDPLLEALKAFLERFKYGSFTQQDLWDSLSNSTGRSSAAIQMLVLRIKGDLS